MLRLAGIQCLLRESVDDGVSQFTFSVKAIDVERAIKLVENSNAISFHIVNRINRNVYADPQPRKEPVPLAKDMTIEFLRPYRTLVTRILAEEFRELSWITKNKCYPIIGNAKSAEIGTKFISGLVAMGLGKHETRGNKKGFRRYHPNEEDCPAREKVIDNWNALEIEWDQTVTSGVRAVDM